MNIIEVRNNLVKLCYEEDLTLSGLLLIKDAQKSYIAQIMHLESTRIGKVAVAKILFCLRDKIYTYDGSIPSLRAEISELETSFILDNLDDSASLVLGKLLAQDNKISVDFDMLHENPIILAEKFYTAKVLLNNIAIQLQSRKKKIVVFDTVGFLKSNHLSITKDFKLPLNSSTINYIYEKGFEDATAESKALIQSIFEELGEYSKTVDFIPFDTFKAVVDSEFARTKLMQLIIMKNKIKQIRDWNVFAQSPAEFGVLKDRLVSDDTVVIDIACLKTSLQHECIKYVYSLLKEINQEFYVFTPLGNDGVDKFLLNQIYSTENAHTTVICDYDFKYLSELKKCSKNMIMFTPLKQQKDFGSYNVFLQKLSENEMIVYGKMTKFVPVIVNMTRLTTSDIFVPKVTETIKTQEPQEMPVVIPEPQVSEEPVIQVDIEQEVSDLTVETEADEQKIADETDVVTETAEIPITPEVSDVDSDGEPVEAQDAAEVPSSDEVHTDVEDEVIISDDEQPSVVQDDTAPAEAEEPQFAAQEEAAEQDDVASALNAIDDVVDDELSDDDLDMIEELSKPDEEIEVLNTDAQSEEVPVQDDLIPQENPVSENPVPVDVPVPDQPEPLQTRANTNPVVPEYDASIPEEDRVNSDPLAEGDRVVHEEFGEGVVEKMINYGDKILCSVNFASVGRRLLNPDISEMKKV